MILEDGKEDFSFEAWSAPIDVEKAGIRGVFAVLEHIEPPGIGEVGGHMVGNQVQQESHVVLPQCCSEAIEMFLRAQGCIEAGELTNVVSVQAIGNISIASLQHCGSTTWDS